MGGVSLTLTSSFLRIPPYDCTARKSESDTLAALLFYKGVSQRGQRRMEWNGTPLPYQSTVT